MKKRVIVTSILSVLFLALGGALFVILGSLMNKITNAGAVYTFSGVLHDLPNVVKAEFTKPGIMSFVNFGICAVLLILLIIQLILFIRKRHGVGLIAFVVFLVEIAMIYAFINITFVPGYKAATGASYYSYTAGSKALTSDSLLGIWGMFYQVPVNGGAALNWGTMIVMYVPALLFLVGFIIAIVFIISELRLLASLPKPVKKGVTTEDEVMVIHDEDLDSEDSRDEAQKALDDTGYAQRHSADSSSTSGVQGPFVIQYINTYGPSEPQKHVPVGEIQENIGDKPLSADDIRKIVKEELGERKESPVIVTVPSPSPEAKKEEPLTAEDVRKIFSEELGRYLAADDEEGLDDGEIIVEEEPEPGLSADDIRAIIASELEKSKPAAEPPVRDVVREELASYAAAQDEAAKKKEEEEKAAKAHADAIEEARREAAEEARREAEEKAKKEAEEEAKPLTADDIREIIAAELAKAAPKEEPKEEKPGLTEEQLREIIAAELAKAAPKEEPKEEPAMPTVNIIVKKDSAPAEPAPEPVVIAPEPEPEVEEKPRAVGEVNPELPPHDKIVRIPFPTRMLDADEELRANYNELKSEILSYGVNSRVSNSGDTFRLHKVTYVKITIAGKALKLYFALNPKDYASSTLPVQDAGHKGTYRDIPLVFKVKSELSVRRAKQLIADVMEKNGLEQGRIEAHNWAEDLRDYKPTGSDKDD